MITRADIKKREEQLRAQSLKNYKKECKRKRAIHTNDMCIAMAREVAERVKVVVEGGVR